MANSGKHKILGFASVMLMVAASAMAGEAAKGAPQDASFLDQFLNWLLSLDPFSLALLLIVVSTIIGTLLKGRSRDRCYKMMAGFNVFLVLDDRKAQGVLEVGNAGIETTLDNSQEGPYGPRTGFILPKSEYERINIIYMIPAGIKPASVKRRRKLIRRVIHPGLLRRFKRWLSNLAGSFKDAFNDMFNLLVGRVSAGKAGLKAQQTHVNKIQQDLASVVPNASYDVILEKLRGRRVEIELSMPDMPESVSALLGDYTANNIIVFDTVLPIEPAPLVIEERDEKQFLKNDSDRPVMPSWAGWKIVEAGGELELTEPPPEDAKAFFAETVDAVFSRSSAQIRYRLGKTETKEQISN